MKYTFEKLKKHTEMIQSNAEPLISKNKVAWDDAVTLFSEYFQKLEDSPESTIKNVKMLLVARFMNHLYSSFLLVVSGMSSDAVTCQRSAIEVLSAYKLLCVEPELAEKYNKDKFLKPYEVRDQLGNLGYPEEKEKIKGIYSSASGITHVNRDHERFTVKWEQECSSVLYIGGRFSESDISHQLEFLPILIHWYLMPLEKSANKRVN
jgi:hypothetical protein